MISQEQSSSSSLPCVDESDDIEPAVQQHLITRYSRLAQAIGTLKDVVVHPTREEKIHFLGAAFACILIVLFMAFLRELGEWLVPVDGIQRPSK